MRILKKRWRKGVWVWLAMFYIASLISPDTRGFTTGIYFTGRVLVQTYLAPRPTGSNDLFTKVCDTNYQHCCYQTPYTNLAAPLTAEILTRTRYGTRLSWVKADDLAFMRKICRHPTESSEIWPFDKASDRARFLLQFSPLELGKWVAILGTGTMALGVTMPVWLPILLLLWLLFVCGRPTPINAANVGNPHHEPHQELVGGHPAATSHQDTSTPGSGAVLPAIIWTTLIVLGIAWVGRDCRMAWLSRMIRSSRAPPFDRKECSMFRVISLILLVLLVAPVQAATSLVFHFGEWQTVRGSKADLVYTTPNLTSITQTFLNGELFEQTTMFGTSRPWGKVMVGPIVGVQNKATGTKPYMGLQFTGGLRLNDTDSLSTLLLTRHNSDGRMHDLLVAAIDHRFGKLSVGLSYEPIRRPDTWEQRFALRLGHPVRWGKLFSEIRKTVNADRRWTTYVDIVVPLGK